MVECRNRLGLVLESADLVVARELGIADHLQGDESIQADLARLVDDAHPPLAEDGDRLVVADVTNLLAGARPGFDGAGRCGLVLARHVRRRVMRRGSGVRRRVETAPLGRSRRTRRCHRLWGCGFGQAARRRVDPLSVARCNDDGPSRGLGPTRRRDLPKHHLDLGFQLGVPLQPILGRERAPTIEFSLDLVAHTLQSGPAVFR
jgi:hypothetical protein